jgi:hypothetical protein
MIVGEEAAWSIKNEVSNWGNVENEIDKSQEYVLDPLKEQIGGEENKYPFWRRFRNLVKKLPQNVAYCHANLDSINSRISKTGKLADTIQDSTHRTVTDTEKADWNNTNFSKLTNVPVASEGAAGIVQLADDNEASAGTNQTKAITPKQLKAAIDGIGTVFNLKGSVSSVSALPTTGNEIGDVYYVVDESVGYVWLNDGTTTRWEQLGQPIDLSTYLEVSDIVNNLTSNATNKPLSAYQGYLLSQMISNLQSNTANKDGSNLSQSNIDAWKTLLGIDSSNLDNYVKFSDIVNNLNGTADKPLSAYQGYVLNQNKADKSTTYTKTEVDTLIQGFITNTVDNLVNYYTKSQTYSKIEVDNLVSAIPKFAIEVVNSLPTTNISSTTIYLLRNQSSSGGDLYTEYIYVNNTWENLGTQTLDLSGYVTTQALNTALANYYTSSQVDSLLSGKANSSALSSLESSVNTQIGALGNRVSSLETDNTTNKSNISALQSSNTTLQGKVTTLENQMAEQPSYSLSGTTLTITL